MAVPLVKGRDGPCSLPIFEKRPDDIGDPAAETLTNHLRWVAFRRTA